MESVKQTVKDTFNDASSKHPFEKGFKVPPHTQDHPGSQSQLSEHSPAQVDTLPDGKGGSVKYKAAGKLDGKRALITGGDSGIGRSIAVLFSLEGADVFITHLPEESNDAAETKRIVESNGRKCHTFPINLTTKEAAKQVVNAALENFGKIDILVNNQGYQMTKPSINELDEEQWLHTFDVNIHPVFYLTKYLLPQMTSGDTIINNASINAYNPTPTLLDYSATKGAIIAFTRSLNNQIASTGIRVNAVCPGPVWTPLIPTTMSIEMQKEFTTPLGRPAQPSEIATCFVFLASNDSSMISGQSLHPNGGTVVNS